MERQRCKPPQVVIAAALNDAVLKTLAGLDLLSMLLKARISQLNRGSDIRTST